MVKKKKPKLTTAEIMKAIIDEDLLKERKETASSAITKTTIVNEKFEIIPKWFEIPIKKSDFIIKEHENKFYAKHNKWKNKIKRREGRFTYKIGYKNTIHHTVNRCENHHHNRWRRKAQ